jgi:predicted transcriptional regulator
MSYISNNLKELSIALMDGTIKQRTDTSLDELTRVQDRMEELESETPEHGGLPQRETREFKLLLAAEDLLMTLPTRRFMGRRWLMPSTSVSQRLAAIAEGLLAEQGELPINAPEVAATAIEDANQVNDETQLDSQDQKADPATKYYSKIVTESHHQVLRALATSPHIAITQRQIKLRMPANKDITEKTMSPLLSDFRDAGMVEYPEGSTRKGNLITTKGLEFLKRYRLTTD